MYTVNVDNIKCGGCASTIRKAMLEIENVNGVEVDVDASHVSIDAVESETREAVLAELLRRGYPETGSAHGIDALGAKAKSFVSCAVGRMSDD